MNKLEELRLLTEDINKAQKRVNALRSEIEKLEKEAEWPQEGCEVWCITSFGDAVSIKWEGGFSDCAIKGLFGIFRTKQEAERQAKRLRIMRQLDELADGGNWSIVYDIEDCIFLSMDWRPFMETPWLFSTEEKGEEVIKTIGEENLKLVFNV